MNESNKAMERIAQAEQKQKRVKELNREAKKEAEAVNEKHREMLEEYAAEKQKIARANDEFNAKWKSKLSEYNKEIDTINKKYKALAKSI
jgi:chromosome segregation ATPase